MPRPVCLHERYSRLLCGDLAGGHPSCRRRSVLRCFRTAFGKCLATLRAPLRSFALRWTFLVLCLRMHAACVCIPSLLRLGLVNRETRRGKGELLRDVGAPPPLESTQFTYFRLPPLSASSSSPLLLSSPLPSISSARPATLAFSPASSVLRDAARLEAVRQQHDTSRVLCSKRPTADCPSVAAVAMQRPLRTRGKCEDRARRGRGRVGGVKFKQGRVMESQPQCERNSTRQQRNTRHTRAPSWGQSRTAVCAARSCWVDG